MPNTDIETCRRCGKTGYKIDEFLEYWTGLCKGCYDAAHAPHKTPNPETEIHPSSFMPLNCKITGLIENPAATIQREATGCKNQPEQIRRYTRQHLEDLESTYRVLGRAALLDYLEGYIEETLYAIRSQVRQDEDIENGVQMAMMRAMEREREKKKKREADGERGPGPKTS